MSEQPTAPPHPPRQAQKPPRSAQRPHRRAKPTIVPKPSRLTRPVLRPSK